MSKRRIRFSLASLLIVSTAIVLFLGYAQWRSQRIISQCLELRDEGVDIDAPPETFWPSVPIVATVKFSYVRPGRYESGGKTFSPEQAKRHFRSLDARMRKLGIQQVGILLKRPLPKAQIREWVRVAQDGTGRIYLELGGAD